MGRPEADQDHQPSSSNQACHPTHCELQDSEKPEQQVSSPNPSIIQTYVFRAENDHQQQEQGHTRTSSTNSQESQAIQTHQKAPPLPYDHNVRYYFPTPNNPQPPHPIQAMPPGLRPHPTSLYPPPPPSPPPPPPPPLYQSQPLNNYRPPPQPLHNFYSGSQQVVMYPPPAAYNYRSNSLNPQPYVNHNNSAATGIPMMQNIQYVPVLMPQLGSSGEGTTWKTGLCDCFLDLPNAIMTMICPCWTFGQIAEIVDNGQTSCSCNALLYMIIWFFIMVPCLFSCTYRRKLRNKLDLPESPGPDCIIHVLCELCALCQEHRELELRGLDPSLGWVGNMEQLQRLQKKRQGTVVTPPMPQRMGN
ncbi:hypothetical protein ACLB2K_048353 [Fragaria x ananassa]